MIATTNTSTNNTAKATNHTKARAIPFAGSANGASTLLAARDDKEFTIASPIIDVRGWEACGPTGMKIGTVDRIMLDKAERKPRYLLISLQDRKEHLLMPIGVGTLDKPNKRILFDTMAPEAFKAIPLLAADVVTPEFERRVVGAVTGKANLGDTPQQWYADPAFNPMNLFASKAAAIA